MALDVVENARFGSTQATNACFSLDCNGAVGPRPKSVQESLECKGLAAERDGHGELSVQAQFACVPKGMNDVCGWSISQRIRSRFDRNPIFPAHSMVFDSIPRLQVLSGCPRHSLEGLAAELGVALEARF